MVKTVVVILNYNGVDYLRQFLPKVIEHSPGCQVVVIDNNSSDGSRQYLENHPEVLTVVLSENYGYSGGYNRGLRQIEADYYILLNSDVEVTGGWVEKMYDFMETHQQVAACQPKILSFKNRDRFDYAGAAGGGLDFLGYPFCRGRIFNHLEQDQGQYDRDQLVFWASGACFFVRAELFHKCGGFDEEFFAHMEEIDLCWRIHRAGYQVGYVGSSIVFHVGGGTLKDTNPFKTYLNFRNGMQLLIKNCAVKDLVWKLPVRMMLDMVAGLRFLLMGSFSHFWAVMRAEAAFLFTIPQTLKKRNSSGLGFTSKLYQKSIVWQYFIRGKKTYQQLSGIGWN